MPAKSQAQARWAGAAYRRGEISRKQLRHFVKGRNIKALPEHVKKRKRRALQQARYKGR